MCFFLFLLIGVGNQGIGSSCLVFMSGIKLNFLSGKRLFLLAVVPLFPQIFHRKFLMPEVMSAALKANVNSNFSPEGGRWRWQSRWAD